MQAIQTRYLSATDTKGSRIKATAAAGSVTIGYPHELNSEDGHRKAAKALMAKMGWDQGWHGDIVTGQLASGDYVHVMTRFVGHVRNIRNLYREGTPSGNPWGKPALADAFYALAEFDGIPREDA